MLRLREPVFTKLAWLNVLDVKRSEGRDANLNDVLEYAVPFKFRINGK